MVQIFSLYIKSDISLDFESLFLYLNKKKVEKIKSYKVKKDAERCLLADLLVRCIIIVKLGIRNNEIEISFNKFGKPYLKNCSDFQFNISHSGDYIVCAISNHLIGIDIEEKMPLETTSLGKRFFSYPEYIHLINKSKKEQLDCFYKFWTLKESYIKCIGTGLSSPLNSFSFTFSDEYEQNINFHCESEKRPFSFKHFSFNPLYSLSVCSLSSDIPKDIYCQLTNENLLNFFSTNFSYDIFS